MITILLYLYIFFASWGGAFALGPWFPLHVVLLLTAFVLSIPYVLTERNFPRGIYHFEDLFILFGILAISISGILNPNIKTMNYLKAYFYIFGIGYFVLKFLLYKNISLNRLFIVNLAAVLFVAVFAIAEVASSYFFRFDLQTVIPRPIPAGALYHTVLRAYGFASEPGTLAFYFNTLGILALWKLWNYKTIHIIIKYILTILMVAGWVCTFSAGGFAFMSLSLVIVFIIRSCDNAVTKKRNLTTYNSATLNYSIRNYKSALNKLVILVSIILVTFIIIEHYKFAKYAVDPIIGKITLRSGQIRISHWHYALSVMFDNPFFGKGIGYLSSIGRGSSHNWYLFLALEAGFIAAACFVLFLVFTFIRIVKSRIPQKYWFMTGFLAAALGFTTFSAIHDPFPWILIALFNVVLAIQDAGGDIEG